MTIDKEHLDQYEKNILKLPFDNFYDPEIEFSPSTHKGKPALEITISSMYGNPTWDGEGGLYGLCKAINEATESSGIDIIDEFARPGCDTCDYGSSYGKVYKVWEETNE